MSEEDIEIAEFWLDAWESEIAGDENNDREMYAEDRKVILAVRRIIAVALSMVAAIERSGFDVSHCMDCGEMVVCIPDGMPMCEACAAKGGDA